MNKPKNILFISSWFPNKLNPTLGNFVMNHAQAVALNHNVSVINVVKSSEQGEKYLEEDRRENNVNLKTIYFKSSETNWGIIDSLINTLRRSKSYFRLYKSLDSKPDLIHANVIWPIGLLALWFKFRYNIKYVLTEHWSIYQKENRSKVKGVKKMLFKKIAKNASRIMPVSYQLKEAMVEFGLEGQFTIVPNAFDTNIFSFQKKETGSPFKFLHVSTLVDEVKNVSGILRSFKKLLEIDAENELTIVSDGYIRPFEEMAKQLEIPERNIRFFGTQTAKEISWFYHQNHAFVLFSNYENLPVVIIESFATGTPVISSNVGGISDFFPEDFGYLIPKKDEKALLDSMIRIKQAYRKFPFSKMSEYADKTFSNRSVSETYSGIYKEILDGY